MCGIAGIHIKPKARGTVKIGHLMDNLLLGIESRGKDATGFMSVTFDNQIVMDKSDVPARTFVRKRKNIKNNTQTVILHTRLATQGHQSQMENNHPVQYGTMFVTHNGVIFNDSELFKENGWERNAAVDTVAIPAVLWDMCEGGNFNNAGAALEKIDGMMAIAAIDVKNPGTVLLARGYSSPLVYIETKDMIVWASTVAAIQHMWSKCLGTPPKENKFVNVKEGELFVIENGVMTKDTFEYKVHDYSYGYTTRQSVYPYGGTATRVRDDDWSWSGKDDYEYPKQRGYWVEDNGTRRYVEMGKTNKPALPPMISADVLKAEEYTEWAEADLAINKEAMAIVAEEWALSPDLVEWMIVYAPENVIEGDVSMTLVHERLKEAYLTTYDDLTEHYTVPKSDKKLITSAQFDCVDCGDPLYGDNIYRCNLCMASQTNPMMGLLTQTTGGE